MKHLTAKDLERLQVKHRELMSAYTNICEDKDGYLVLLDILNFCSILVTGAESSDNLWMREGQKSVATHIIGRLQEAGHQNYPNLLAKYADEVFEEEKRREAEENGNGRRNEKE